MNKQIKIQIKLPGSSANLGSGFDVCSLAMNIYNYFDYITHTADFQITYEGDYPLNYPMEDNLLIKTYKSICQQNSWKVVPFHLINRINIPEKKGLGSSATAILAGVIIAMVINKQELSKERILNYSLPFENHLDNLAACLYGGFNICALADNKPIVKSIKVEDSLCLLIILTNKQNSTEVYRKKLPKSYGIGDIRFNLSRISLLTYAMLEKDYSYLKYAMEDCLHQNYRVDNDIDFYKLRENLIKSGCWGCCISGSGPAILVLCSRPTQAILCAIDEHFKNLKLNFSLLNLAAENKGLQINYSE